jgi:hypothetical protein
LIRSAFAALFVLSASAVAVAQDAAVAPPHIAIVDGHATIVRDGQAETATSGMPLVEGDQLRTEQGRLEVLFADGTALDVDEFTAFELQAPTLIRLTSGRLILAVAGAVDPANATRYQIDTPVASAFTEGPGEYRVSILNGRGIETELAVFRGAATLSTETGSTRARAGERSVARDMLAPSYPLPFNSARFDAFDRWAASRRDGRVGTDSARYLPRDLYPYSSAFDRYGRWGYEGPYGYVWYPAVAADWRPYHHGRWTSLRRWGWTWIGADPWGWPTHHYGRWGFSHNRWFWIPGVSWGPAWVSWATAPGFVGWCPLGFFGQPVFGLTVGNPWRGWVVVPKPYFGPRYVVHQHVVVHTSIPAQTTFTPVAAPPTPLAVPRPRAIPRPGTGSGNAIARAAGAQSTVAGRQSSVASRQSTVVGNAIANAGPSNATAPRYAPNSRATLAGERAPLAGAVSRRGSTPATAASPDTAAAMPRTSYGAARSPARRTWEPAAQPRTVQPDAAAEAPAATGRRWYPPVTMTRPVRSRSGVDPGVPRGDVASAPGVPRGGVASRPGVPQQPSIGSAPPAIRTAPVPPGMPRQTAPPPSPPPGAPYAMPRTPMPPPAVAAPQPRAAAPGYSRPQSGAPTARPRIAAPPMTAPPPQQAAPQQAAPAQGTPPAGARSPRNR